MDQLLNEIRVVYPDAEINMILSAISSTASSVKSAVRYNHNEELFLELGTELLVPRFPIHHDVRHDEPSALYAYALRDFVHQLVALLPDIFRGLTYFFDPSEPLRPRFYRLYKVEDSIYLFLLRIDLVYRHFQGEIVEPGTNDITPAYRSKRLFIESEIIPLEAVMWEMGRAKAFKVKQLVSNTWIGETGRGYLVHGIWMDADLSKFFSKLILPEGSRTYPFYPLFCKYKTVCAEVAPPDPDLRKRILPLLHRSIAFLAPEMDRIQDSLKNDPFSETMPQFVEMRGRVPPAWLEVFRGFSTRAYLDERDMKEFALETADTSS
jgi:hypothetical protein